MLPSHKTEVLLRFEAKVVKANSFRAFSTRLQINNMVTDLNIYLTKTSSPVKIQGDLSDPAIDAVLSFA